MPVRTLRINLMSAVYIITIQVVSGERSLELLHIITHRRQSPLMLCKHKRAEKDGREGRLQLRPRSYYWWDTSVIMNSGWKLHLCRKMQALRHRRATQEHGKCAIACGHTAGEGTIIKRNKVKEEKFLFFFYNKVCNFINNVVSSPLPCAYLR